MANRLASSGSFIIKMEWTPTACATFKPSKVSARNITWSGLRAAPAMAACSGAALIPPALSLAPDAGEKLV